MDRLMLLGYPLYIVKNGKLFHPMRYGKKSRVLIGICNSCSPEEMENFKALAAANAANMLSSHKAIVFAPSDPMLEVRNSIRLASQEVGLE